MCLCCIFLPPSFVKQQLFFLFFFSFVLSTLIIVDSGPFFLPPTSNTSHIFITACVSRYCIKTLQNVIASEHEKNPSAKIKHFRFTSASSTAFYTRSLPVKIQPDDPPWHYQNAIFQGWPAPSVVVRVYESVPSWVPASLSSRVPLVKFGIKRVKVGKMLPGFQIRCLLILFSLSLS